MTTRTAAPDTGAPCLTDHLEFIDDKLCGLLARSRTLEALTSPVGLENAYNRVVELDREYLAATFSCLADDIDITLAEVRAAIKHAIIERRATPC